MATNTPAGASSQSHPSGSLSAPVLISDLADPPPRRRARRYHSVQELPALEPIFTQKTEPSDLGSSVSSRKRPSIPDTGEASRLKLKRRQQREQYFDALAKEADAMGNLPSSARKVCTEDDLEKLELKRCFELLHAMGRASDPDATIEATRASIGGFLQAIFQGWDTSVEIPGIPEVAAVEVNAPAGRVCDCPSEHANFEACVRSNNCKTQVRVSAVYDNECVTFTYYKAYPRDTKSRIRNGGQESSNVHSDADKEARYQRWLNGLSGDQDGLTHDIADAGSSGALLVYGDTGNSGTHFSLAAEDIENFQDVDPPMPNDDNRINPLTHPNLRIQLEWREVLKTRLHKALLKRMHEQNKYRALWIVRHMVLDWEKGAGIKVEEESTGECWGFVRAENIQEMVLGLF